MSNHTQHKNHTCNYFSKPLSLILQNIPQQCIIECVWRNSLHLYHQTICFTAPLYRQRGGKTDSLVQGFHLDITTLPLTLAGDCGCGLDVGELAVLPRRLLLPLAVDDRCDEASERSSQPRLPSRKNTGFLLTFYCETKISLTLFFTMTWHKELKSLFIKVSEPFILDRQCHDCWCLGDASSKFVKNIVVSASGHHFHEGLTWHLIYPFAAEARTFPENWALIQYKDVMLPV